LLYRFFRSANYLKKNEEEAIKEVFKNKNDIINSLMDKINKIYDVQSKRILFSDYCNKPFTVNFERCQYLDIISNVMQLKHFSYKINVIISNNNSNRVLLPEIQLFFVLSNGKCYSFYVDVKLFQEIRKSIAFHIKKMLDNENIQLLK